MKQINLYEAKTRLSARVVGVLEESGGPLFVSIVGIAELCIKAGVGRLQLPWAGEDPVASFEDLLVDLEIEPLPLTLAHAAQLRDLPLHHRDPFDRLMIDHRRALRRTRRAMGVT
ncbi:type II toxin-antitoxin system VapC family toxin [Phenylobacterium sp.]|uniref:type II toxin-antitoxin system VapC family toxin n=1 Tax=Phenylobacterium sp. TaxID=1871053 RepID=UPI00301C74D7